MNRIIYRSRCLEMVYTPVLVYISKYIIINRSRCLVMATINQSTNVVADDKVFNIDLITMSMFDTKIKFSINIKDGKIQKYCSMEWLLFIWFNK